ncbi:MAG: protein BatD [Elusimicrobia bacterium]|nr:protein BatD [Elusimicrobiota bacterium]
MRLFLLLLPAMAIVPPLSADIKLTLRLEKGKMALGENVAMEVAVVGSAGGLGEPKITIPPEFSVLSQSKSQKIEIVNWNMTTSVVYTLVLSASKPGSYKLGPARLDVGGGQAITSEIVSLEIADQKNMQIPGTPQGVLKAFPAPAFRRSLQDMLNDKQARQQGGGAPKKSAPSPGAAPSAPQSAEPAPIVFVDARTDKKEAFVGEPVKFAVYFHTRVGFLSQPQYAPPNVSGFWHEELPQKTYPATINGVNYHVTEIPMILFPTTSGKLEIGPAKIRVELESHGAGLGTDPFDPKFLQQFLGMGGGETHALETKPVAITGLPLPTQGRPKDFSGAVGQFDIQAELDKKDIKVGESLTMTVTISGQGNIRSLPSPYYPNLDGVFRSYETEKSETISKDKGVITGKKVYKMLLIPQVPGRPTLTIPPIRFVYFDPKTKEYARKETPPMALKVTGEPIRQASGTGSSKETKKISEDIEFIIEETPAPRPLAAAITRLARSWPVTGPLPLALWLAMTLAQTMKEKKQLRKKRPLERLSDAVKQAQSLAKKGDTVPALSHLGTALESAVHELLGLSAVQLTSKAVVAEISRRAAGSISHEEEELIGRTLETIHFLRFAPAKEKSPAMLEELLGNVQRLKTILEKLRK